MGKVQIVGIGPGNFENMTIRADRALAACDVIVGYPVYVDLVKDRYPGKELLATPMTQEAKRCRMALGAGRGRARPVLPASAPATAASTAWPRWSISCAAEAQEPEVRGHPRPHRRRAAAARCWVRR